MYRITTDMTQALIEVKIEGFWSIDQVECFAAELKAHVARIALTGRRQAVLYDYTDAVIQSQDVVCALRELARADGLGSRRVALYTEGRLAKLQARRVAAGNDRIGTFDDRKAALAWLTADAPCPRMQPLRRSIVTGASSNGSMK